MEPLALRSSDVALVVVDLQHGIVSTPTTPRRAAEVIENAGALADALRGLGGLVVLVRVTPRPDRKDALRPIADAPAPAPSQDPRWAELVPRLAGHDEDLVVTKRQWGAFYGTELDLQLRRRGI